MDRKGKDPGTPVLTVSNWGELALMDRMLDGYLEKHGRSDTFWPEAKALRERLTPVLQQATQNL